MRQFMQERKSREQIIIILQTELREAMGASAVYVYGRVLCFMLAAGICLSQTPVPSRPLGFTYISSETPKVVLEIFYDHLCIDSKANWPMLKSVVNENDIMSKGIKVMIHMTSLPYHHDTFFAQRAGVLVRRVDPMQFTDYLELMFANQESFLSGAVNMTEPEVQDKIATLASTKLTISKDMMLTAFTDTTVDNEARLAFKYAGHRGITGTPQFVVNGVHTPDVAGYDKGQWEKYLTQLIMDTSLGKDEL